MGAGKPMHFRVFGNFIVGSEDTSGNMEFQNQRLGEQNVSGN